MWVRRMGCRAVAARWYRRAGVPPYGCTSLLVSLPTGGPPYGCTSLRVYLPTVVPHGMYAARRSASGDHMNIVPRLWRQTKVCGGRAKWQGHEMTALRWSCVGGGLFGCG